MQPLLLIHNHSNSLVSSMRNDISLASYAPTNTFIIATCELCPLVQKPRVQVLGVPSDYKLPHHLDTACTGNKSNTSGI